MRQANGVIPVIFEVMDSGDALTAIRNAVAVHDKMKDYITTGIDTTVDIIIDFMEFTSGKCIHVRVNVNCKIWHKQEAVSISYITCAHCIVYIDF